VHLRRGLRGPQTVETRCGEAPVDISDATLDLDDYEVLRCALHRVDLNTPEPDGISKPKGYKFTVGEGGRELVDWHAGAEDLVVLVVDPKEVHRRVVADQSRVGQERRPTVLP
jgi:hypothetical protein